MQSNRKKSNKFKKTYLQIRNYPIFNKNLFLFKRKDYGVYKVNNPHHLYFEMMIWTIKCSPFCRMF